MWKREMAAAALIGAFWACPALAQSDDTEAQRADSRANRTERATPNAAASDRLMALSAEKKKEFTFTLALPVSFNSNIESADTGRRSAVHADPSVELGWEHESGSVTIFASAAADQDFYSRFKDNNTATLSGSFGIKGNGGALGFTPYLKYVPVAIYESGFGAHVVTLHDFSLGATIDPLAPGSTTRLVLGAELRRREASSAAVEQDRVTASATLKGKFSEDWAWSVRQGVQGRFYTGGANDGRHDLNLSTRLALSWASDPVAIDFIAYFERNDSNRAGKNFSTWDLGPSVSLSFPF